MRNLIKRVTVIIPCFNAEKYISEAIKSCLNQSYKYIETIIVDDGSTDRSPEIIELFGGDITLIKQKNKGGSAARNTGLKHANGEFIKFLDADDFLEPDIIEKQISHFLDFDCSGSIAVYGDFNLVDEESKLISICKSPSIIDDQHGLATLIDSVIITSSPLYRKVDLDKVSGFNETLKSNQEHELNIRLFLAGVRFIYFNDIVYNYRNYYSSSRISCRKWPEKDPLFMWNLIDHYEKQLKLNSVIIFGEISAALASRLVSAGRSLLRAGHFDLADRHFSRAVKICPERNFRIGNRYWITKYYLGFRQIFGLTFTEKLYFACVKLKQLHIYFSNL